MKRTVISIATAFALLIAMAMPCFASENNVEKEYEYYGDGSYAVIETFIDTPAVSITLSSKSTSTKSASRTYTYYSIDDKKQWAITLNATFEYTGSSATAIKSTVSHTIYVSSWECSSKSATKSGATAKATGTFSRLLLTKTKAIGLKCSKSGVVSQVDYD